MENESNWGVPFYLLFKDFKKNTQENNVHILVENIDFCCFPMFLVHIADTKQEHACT